ncbi:MAG: hypothetical protein ABR591_04055 [Candidatus Velthaea sp.]
MIIVRTVNLDDPLARANVLDAFAGRGRPAGVHTCFCDGEQIAIAFDDAVTQPQLVEDLIAVASAYVPERAPPFGDLRAAAAAAARGLGDPELDAARVIETYLP